MRRFFEFSLKNEINRKPSIGCAWDESPDGFFFAYRLHKQNDECIILNLDFDGLFMRLKALKVLIFHYFALSVVIRAVMNDFGAGAERLNYA